MTENADRHLVEVTELTALHDFVVKLTFSDGHVKQVNLEPLLHGSVFDLIRADPDEFAKVHVDHDLGVVAWPNGADIDAELLRYDLPPSWAAHAERKMLDDRQVNEHLEVVNASVVAFAAALGVVSAAAVSQGGAALQAAVQQLTEASRLISRDLAQLTQLLTDKIGLLTESMHQSTPPRRPMTPRSGASGAAKKPQLPPVASRAGYGRIKKAAVGNGGLKVPGKVVAKKSKSIPTGRS